MRIAINRNKPLDNGLRLRLYCEGKPQTAKSEKGLSTMHHEIDYNTLPAAKGYRLASAINDAYDWLGSARFRAITVGCAHDTNFPAFEFLLGFTGISGFPVDALFWAYCPDQKTFMRANSSGKLKRINL